VGAPPIQFDPLVEQESQKAIGFYNKGVFDKGKGLWDYCLLGDYCSFFRRFVLGNQPNSSLITVVNYRNTLIFISAAASSSSTQTMTEIKTKQI
jgi:hypothetical protein